MFKNPSFLFDILCTVVWLVLMARYARKGFLASIVQLSGNLIRYGFRHRLYTDSSNRRSVCFEY